MKRKNHLLALARWNLVLLKLQLQKQALLTPLLSTPPTPAPIFFFPPSLLLLPMRDAFSFKDILSGAPTYLLCKFSLHLKEGKKALQKKNKKFQIFRDAKNLFLNLLPRKIF
jgi:hypothetical protein